MPGYLENLMLRLAAGMQGIDPAIREQHADYLKQSQRESGGFAGREGPGDLYYTGFALRSLALLGELHGPVASRAADFLRGKLQGQAAIVDFFSLLYSAGLLDVAAGIDVFADVPGDWRSGVAAAFEGFRRPDGGYAKTPEGQSSSTYYSFLVLLCLELIDRPIVEPERLIAFVHTRRRDDGGFVEIGPMRRSGSNPTAAAIGILKILSALDETVRADTTEFLVDMQADEGGFLANTRIPAADVLSTFTATLTLLDLGALGEIDVPAALGFVKSVQHADGGFSAGQWDSGKDVEYTFYGLGALALLREPGDEP